MAFASSVATTLYYHDANARLGLERKKKVRPISPDSEKAHDLQKTHNPHKSHGSQKTHNPQKSHHSQKINNSQKSRDPQTIHHSQKGHDSQCLILNDGSLMATATTHNLVSGLKDINNNIKVDTRQYSMEGEGCEAHCFRILVVILSQPSALSMLESSLPVAHCPPCPLVLFSLNPTADDLPASCTEALKRLGYYKLFPTLSAADLEDQRTLKTYFEEIVTLCVNPSPPPYPIFGNKPLR